MKQLLNELDYGSILQKGINNTVSCFNCMTFFLLFFIAAYPKEVSVIGANNLFHGFLIMIVMIMLIRDFFSHNNHLHPIIERTISYIIFYTLIFISKKWFIQLVDIPNNPDILLKVYFKWCLLFITLILISLPLKRLSKPKNYIAGYSKAKVVTNIENNEKTVFIDGEKYESVKNNFTEFKEEMEN